MADKSASKSRRASKGKGSAGKGKAGAQGQPYTSIATHPRASMRVRQSKAWGGLAGFVIAALLSIRASVPFVQTCERALAFGVLGYLGAWALSMLVWRQLMLAEQRAAVAELQRRREQSRGTEEPPQRPRAAAAGGDGGTAPS